MSSNLYFFAKSMNPFMGLLGFSGSFSFFLAGEMGGDIMDFPIEVVKAAGTDVGSLW